MYIIYPAPRNYNSISGEFVLSEKLHTIIDPSIEHLCHQAGYNPTKDINAIFNSKQICQIIEPNHTNLHFPRISIQKGNCPPQGYELEIAENFISILCADGSGLFYSLKTLKQIIDQCNTSIQCLKITDNPCLKVRGVICDIGRGKIPNMDTFYSLIDKLSDMRINHLQFYMEGFCFDYPQYRYLFTDETPVTAEEFKDLSAYASAHFIDLVPNQNVMGHMEDWLRRPQFNKLAECENGFIFENQFWREPMTLDVYDDKSFALVTDLLDTLLPAFSSDYVNVNMDEPFEMGTEKNKEIAEKEGRPKLYFDYLDKIHKYCNSKQKTMLMWGDEIFSHPECIERIPKDAWLLDWIYEGDADFEEHARLMHKHSLNFCLCPGTSSWGSLTGRSNNMKKNIINAADCAIRYGGKGVICTDWGDLGHWQYLSVSYPGYAFLGACSWNGISPDTPAGTLTDLVAWYCNHYIYCDQADKAFQTAYDLGNYYHLEHASVYNTTLSFAVMSKKYTFDSIEEFDKKMERLLILSRNIAKTNNIPNNEFKIAPDYTGMKQWADNIEQRINALQLDGCEGELIQKEMKNGLYMVKHGIRLYHAMKELRNKPDQLKTELTSLFTDLDTILKQHYQLWISRNRSGGFSASTAHILHLLKLYQTLNT